MSFKSSKIITCPNVIFREEYRVDEDGNIWGIYKNLIEQTIDDRGYKNVCLYTNFFERKCFEVHRLVMEAFSPNPNSEILQINHKDGNKTNNNINNLEWIDK